VERDLAEHSRRFLIVHINPITSCNWAMSNVSVADALNHLSDVIARFKEEAVCIERRGQRAAVVISPEQYGRMLEALEDAEDAVAFDEAMAEEGPSIPWAQVKADLDWV
jgi:antitoxin Phd